MSPSLPTGTWSVRECRSIHHVVEALHFQRHCDILACLVPGERYVKSVAVALHLGEPAVSKALAALYGCGLVERLEVKNFVFYRVTRPERVTNVNGILHVDVDAPREHLSLDILVQAVPDGSS